MKYNSLPKIARAAVLSLAWLQFGCDATENPAPDEIPGRVRVNAGSVSPLLAGNSAVGFYMVNRDAGLSSSRVFDNVKLVRSGDEFTTEPALFYPVGERSSYDAYAYAPYRKDAIPAGDSDFALSVLSDQSSRENYEASDFLLARTEGHHPTKEAMDMCFEHTLARIDIVLKAGGSYASVADIPAPQTAALAGISTEGLLDFDDGRFTSVGLPAALTPYGAFVRQDDVLAGVSAVVIPQTVKAGSEFIVIDAGEDNYRYVPQSDLTFERGKAHTVTLTLNASFDNVTITMETRVEDWADGGITSVGGNEVLPPDGPTVEDADGNVYPIVRIGRRYWMATNLRAAHYNDGTPIPEITDPQAWLEATEGARCSYDNEPANYAVYGGLYNRKAINTRKLCPTGWHVPSGADWDMLASDTGGAADDYQAWHGVGAALKAESGWPDGQNGDNESGFAGLPGGYRYADDSYQGYSSYQNAGVYGCWWSMTEVSAYMSYARTLQDDVLYRYLRSNQSGCSVRCIHDF